ncbi:MAG: PAS domain-containing protein, partial [Candidatus Thorarchaeota archaeon]
DRIRIPRDEPPELTVADSEARYRSFIESTPMGIHIYKLEHDYRLIFFGANPAADKLLGVDNSAFLGKTLEEVFPNLAATEILDRYREVAITGRPWSTNLIEYKDDKIRGAFEVHAFQIEPGLLATTFLDISDRKKAEVELLESETLHRTLVESMHDLVFVYDKDNRYMMYFAAADHPLYASTDDFLGKHVSDVLPDDVAYTLIVRSRRVRETGIPETFDYMMELNGTILWFSATVSLHEDGQSIVAVVRDISKRKIAEESIQQQRDFLERVIDSLTHPFYVIDAEDYTIQTANNASGLGFIDGSQTCYGLTHHRKTPCNGKEHPCPLLEVKRTGKPAIVEHIHFDKDGNALCHRVHGYPIFDSNANIVQMIEYNLDITDQRRAESQLETESKRARLYLDLLAHDMANQIHIISGSVELLHEMSSKQDIDQFSQFIERIEYSIEKCARTISKARSTDRIASISLVERSLLRVLLDCIDSLHEDKDSVILEIADDITDASIHADSFLEILITNLLENAINHNTSDLKQVWVVLQRKANGYELSIADNGPGISDSVKMNLFDLEHRSGGLGLHLSAEITEKYDGYLTVSDRILHKSELGANFVVWFPEMGDVENE